MVSIITQATDPQVVTGSMDSTVKLWDLAAGKAMCTLTNHKKGVRAMAMHPREYTFASASADNIKKWKLPKGDFLHNLPGHNTIVHSMAINEDGVLVTGGDDGSLCFWDWKTGHLYQRTQTIVQPGTSFVVVMRSGEWTSYSACATCATRFARLRGRRVRHDVRPNGFASHHLRGRQDHQGVEGG